MVVVLVLEVASVVVAHLAQAPVVAGCYPVPMFGAVVYFLAELFVAAQGQAMEVAAGV